MGRHSKPGPGESFGEPNEPADDRESPTDGFSRPEGRDLSGYLRGEPAGYDEAEDYESEDAGAAPTPPPPPGRAGARRRDGWQGGHRSEGGRRGVSIGVIVALVTVVVVVGAVILWRLFGDALSDRSRTAAQQCLEGTAGVAVIADPSIADNVTKFAETFNKNATPVGDRCIKVTVRSSGSDPVINGFIGNWPDDLGERPALWIPASSVSAARLQSVAGEQTISDSRSLVTSPVLLAVQPQLKDALAEQNWSTLPRLQSDPASLDALNLPGWGSLRLALPTNGDSDASYLAAEAVAAASAPPNSPATAGIGALNTLIANQPKLADNTANEAWNALLSPGDPAVAPVHAVATTEQQLFQRASSVPDAKKVVAAWLPPGPVALANYPTVLLAGPWLSEEQVSAASEFARFMHKPDQLSELAKSGFRAEGTTPPSNDVVNFAALGAPLSIGDDAVRVTLADAMAAPITEAATTIMLDQSMTTDEGGRSRLANVISALDNRINALPPNAAVGLWTLNGVEGRSVVPMGPLTDDVNGQPRSAALTGSLDSLSSTSGGAVSFTTLRLVYGDALANFREGHTNSVLVITSGPHTDQTLDGPGLQAYVKSAVDPAKPVAINVIDIGDDPDRASWEAVAQLSGGTYQNVATSDSPELANAVTAMLS